MQKILDLFKHKSVRQFIKFGIVGLGGTLVDWVVYFILTRYFGTFYLIAKTISFVLAAVNNYIFNRIWTFKSKDKNIAKEFLKFFVVSVVGLIFNLLIMKLAVVNLKLNDLIGLVLATSAVTLWNFFANKLWTFKEEK